MTSHQKLKPVEVLLKTQQIIKLGGLLKIQDALVWNMGMPIYQVNIVIFL